MKKSLIEISRPETKSFSGYAELADHLKAVNNASEWTIVRSEETSFDGDSGANTFEAMGGDEFSCVTVKAFGGEAMNVLLNEPFRLCEIEGFGFLIVDQIARKTTFSLTDPMRICGAIRYVLQAAATEGHLSKLSEDPDGASRRDLPSGGDKFDCHQRGIDSAGRDEADL